MLTFSTLPKLSDFLILFKKFNKETFNKKIQKLTFGSNYFYYLSFSRWSIYILCVLRIKILKKKIINLWVPEYFCDSALTLLDSNQVKINYYEVDNEFQVNQKKFDLQINSAKKLPDIIIGVKYFGKDIELEYLRNISKKVNSWFIEDLTHFIELPKKINQNTDFIILSPYKHFAIPDGAILVVNEKFINQNDLKNDFKNLNSILKFLSINLSKNNNLVYFAKWSIRRLIQKFLFFKIKHKDLFYLNFNKDINKLNLDPYMNIYSKKLLNVQIKDLEKIKLKKILLYNFFKKLDQIYNNIRNNLIILSSDNYELDKKFNTPYNFISKSETDLYKKYLFFLKKNIPIYTWPDLKESTFKNSSSIAYKLRFKYIFLPLNHTFSLSELIKKFNLKYDYHTNRITIKEIDNNEWLDIYNDISFTNILQSLAYSESGSKFIKKRKLKFESSNNETAYCILYQLSIFFLKIYRINRGPLFTSNSSNEFKTQVYNNILNYGNLLKGRILLFQPEMNYNFENLFFLNKQKCHLLDFCKYSSSVINLKDDLHTILKNTKYFWRNHINSFSKSNIEILENTNQITFSSFLKNYSHYKTEKLFKGINSSKLNYLFKNKNNYERILIFEAKVNNKILSQVCIFLHGQTATYLASWQKNTELKINLTAVLLWDSVKYLKNININFLDLGGINLDIFDGISFFKKGMGGKRYYLVNNILKI